MTKSRYPRYKSSHIDWIGDIPEDWEMRKLRYCIKNKITDWPHETPVFLDEWIPFLSVDSIQSWELIFENCRYISEEDHSAYKKKANVEKNDILLGKAASTWKVARVKVNFEFSIWSPLALIKTKESILSPNLLEYLLKSDISQFQIENLCTSNTQKNISMADIPRLNFPLPPLFEQQTITDYLDDKTTKIDQTISLKKDQIELLKEKRTAMINQTVTKWLDSNVEMVDSGIEWIRKIPKGWEVRKLKYCLKKLTDWSHTSVEVLDEWLPYVTVTNIYEDRELIDLEDCKKISQIDFDQLVRNWCKPKIWDILFSQIWTIGLSIEVKENDDFVMLSSLAILSPNNYIVINRLLIHFLRSYILKQQWQLLMVGGAVKRITLNHINNFDVIVPIFSEQKAIVTYLDYETALIDQTIATVQHSIDLLVEYKQSLISHLVTGKVKVF